MGETLFIPGFLSMSVVDGTFNVGFRNVVDNRVVLAVGVTLVDLEVVVAVVVDGVVVGVVCLVELVSGLAVVGVSARVVEVGFFCFVDIVTLG